MARIVVLDAGPLGLVTQPTSKQNTQRCRDWMRLLVGSGVRIVVPEIADDEVRRELIRARATAGLLRLDRLVSALDYDPITTAAIRLASQLWADLRNQGLPTAHNHALDADCILAAQALTLAIPGDALTIATTNIRHITRFQGVDARRWETIIS